MTESIVPVTGSVISDPDAQAAIWFLGALSQVRVSGAQTGGAFALADQIAQRGNASPVHVHHRDDETFVVLDGELRVFAGEEEHAALLAVRGLPALLGLRANGTRSTMALRLLQATSLPVIVTATQIGVAVGKLSSVTAAALVCAGLLSVLIFPLIALGLLRRDEPGPAAPPAAPGRRQVQGETQPRRLTCHR
jgi:hypothetical protein